MLWANEAMRLQQVSAGIDAASVRQAFYKGSQCGMPNALLGSTRLTDTQTEQNHTPERM